MGSFKERFKEELEKIRKIEREKYDRYINGDYKKINSTFELRDILTMKKGDMYCLNEKNIYIYSGYKYYWERYRVNHKKKVLTRISCLDDDNYQGCYEFNPSGRKCRELKEKQNNNILLSEEERKAISYNDFQNSFSKFWLIVLGIIIFLEYIF